MVIEPLAAPPDAVVRVPGSKSITNRAVLCAAMAEGTSVLTGVLQADDTDAMVAAVQQLGAKVEAEGTTLTITGNGGRLPAEADIWANLSGTTARFLAPVLAAGGGRYRLDGGAPLRARPMGPLLDALRSIGAVVTDEGEPGHLPVVIQGGARGGQVEVPGHMTSQFLSALMLAGPLFAGGLDIALTTPLVSKPYVELTRSVMEAFGAGKGYRAADYAVEPDASAASYFFAAAAITAGRVTVEGIGTGNLQGDAKFVDLLERMGATVERAADRTTVVGPRQLRGIDADLADLPDMALTLAVVAVFADAPTTITGVEFIRGHETDRIEAVRTELGRLGIEVAEAEGGFTVYPGRPTAGRIETYDDHRMAMSFALLGLVVPGIEIADPGVVAKTYPDYFHDLDQLRSRGR
ncbi:MAG: 3-phosphoshikimate 1-carboxyvinyltransferase [Actinomycetota bacterium]|jgi:3-phosphoshikimate 1-carboxyvinyltransferase|nr:3-phosphoshikimate 1-carboxyvinyltransferase [Actinomycetota bacterium]